MILPRVDATSSAPPAPGSSPSHKSYNIITICIAVISGVIILACFYLLHWRKRPNSPKAQLVVSRTGVTRLRVGGPERWRIIEQSRREQEVQGRSEADWALQKEGLGRDGAALPKYSKEVVDGDRRANQLDVVAAQAHATITIPPPAYNQTGPRSP